MLAVNALAMLFLTPLASLVSSGRELQLIGAHLERLADVLEAEPEQTGGKREQLPALQGNIELAGVTFGYRPESPIVHEISLRVQAGQKVALVGPTGSGKSTLAMLLLGLYPPDAGSVLYDGVPLDQLDLGWLRRQCGVVLQEPFLFSGSIRQNIAFKDPALSLGEVREAARLAAIDEEIMQMPMGYETLLNEGGLGLSGGQRQRLALARALVQRPAILLLDEATSNLDTVTEAAVDQHLDRLGCTRIVIAHRLSTVRNADQILVLYEGRLVEQGRHEELVTRGGQYAALVHGQDAVGPG
jgi:ABC-type bacteriocin/lantibiotic exporter with double-glycine peptidase domain